MPKNHTLQKENEEQMHSKCCNRSYDHLEPKPQSEPIKTRFKNFKTISEVSSYLIYEHT